MFDDESKQTYDAASLYSDLLDSLSGNGGRPIPRGEDASHLEIGWQTWLTRLLPQYMSDAAGNLVPFGEHHHDFWDWVWALQPDIKPRPFVGIWPRGGGKSTSAELAAVMVGALRKRRYVLYICDTIERAEDHVQNVAGMLELPAIERYYPHIARPLVGKTGASKGWRRNRLRTASGFTVDALGMNVAARGVKLDDVRPDLIIIDDIDVETDGPAMTAKKISTLTKKFFPAGSTDSGVLFVQNLIHPESIASRLAGIASEPADFLRNRILSGPFPAVHDLTWEEYDGRYVVTGGTPIWQGMDVAKCEEKINEWGISAFLSESQQEVEDAAGGMFDHLDFNALHVRYDQVPEIVRGVVCVDPAITSVDQSDSHGIQADGIAEDDRIYRLWSFEARITPEKSLVLAITKAIELGFLDVVVETDQGGDTWEFLYYELVRRLQSAEGVEIDGQIYRIHPGQRVPAFNHRKAGSIGSKTHRASQMLVHYERNRFRHVLGTHTTLEKALHRFPRVKPFDLTDAAFWAWHFLTEGGTLPYAWKRNDPEFRKRVAERLQAETPHRETRQTEDERIAARIAAYEQSQGWS